MGTKNKQRARSGGGSDSDRASSKEPARSLSRERQREAERAAIVGQVGEDPTPAELAAAQALARAAIAAKSGSAVPLCPGAAGGSAASAGGSAASTTPEVISVAAAHAGATMTGPKAPADEGKPVKAAPQGHKAAPVGAWVSGITNLPARSVVPGKFPPPGVGAHQQAPLTPPKRRTVAPVSLNLSPPAPVAQQPKAAPVVQQSAPVTVSQQSAPAPVAKQSAPVPVAQQSAPVPVAQQPVPETPAPCSATQPAVSLGPPSPVATTAPATAAGPRFASSASSASAPTLGDVHSVGVDYNRPPVAAAFLADPRSAEFVQCMSALQSMMGFADHVVLAVLARCNQLTWLNLQRLVAHTLEHQLAWAIQHNGPQAVSEAPQSSPQPVAATGPAVKWGAAAVVQPKPVLMPTPKTRPQAASVQAPVGPQQNSNHEPKVASILRRGSASRAPTPGPAASGGQQAPMRVLDPNRAFMAMEDPSGETASPPRPPVILSDHTDRPRGARRRSADARRPRSRSVGASRAFWDSCTMPCPDCHFGLCGRAMDPSRGPHDKHWCSLCKTTRERQGRWPPTTP